MLTFDILQQLSQGNGTTMVNEILKFQSKTTLTADQIRARLLTSLQVMREAVVIGIAKKNSSPTGLSGGDASRVLVSQFRLMGNIGTKAVSFALATAEVNADMGRIVAAPTAGSSGVLPGVLLAIGEALSLTDTILVDALIVAGAIGLIISERATLAGAEGGCQAECGSAAAMAAGAAVFVYGGSIEAVTHAAALALKNLTGLACDPVAGLVEVPCVKRNAGGAAIALLSAQLALSGVRSKIPPDEVITAIAEVGRLLPVHLKETALGGLANTKTARQIEKRILGEKKDA
ncbi:MAG: L-serine dehydratase [Bacillota bacterium]|nr:MAG: L-serine dehydratase [Bacillota bacterium]